MTGRRACPPENVGGPSGYADFLVALDDPAHPEHTNFKELVDDDFDPAAFSAEAVTARLHKLADHGCAGTPDRPVEQLDLSSSRFAEVLTLFDNWARDRGEEIDLATLDLALVVRADFGGEPDPRRWHRGDVEELLLELLPRRTLAADVPAETLLPTLDAFLRFLAESRRLRSNANVVMLRRELASAGPRFPDAMRIERVAGRHGISSSR